MKPTDMLGIRLVGVLNVSLLLFSIKRDRRLASDNREYEVLYMRISVNIRCQVIYCILLILVHEIGVNDSHSVRAYKNKNQSCFILICTSFVLNL